MKLPQTAVRILLVEDNPAEARLLEEMLREVDTSSFSVTAAGSLREGIERLGDSEVMLLDLTLPDASGLETFVQAHQAVDVPIVVVTGLDDEALALQAVVEGAQDYLVKGHFDSDSLNRAIRYAIERHRLTAQRRQAEHALRESEERYRGFFEEDLTGDCVVTASGRIVDCNPAFATIFGFEAVSQAKGSDLATLFPDRVAWNELFDRLRRDGKVERFEIEGRKRSGRPVLIIGNAIAAFDEDGELDHFHAYLFDDTERVQAEEHLRQAQKMEAVGRLAGGVAHDFSNILTAITFHAEYLLGRMAKGDPLRDRMVDIKRAAQQASSLTGQLLAFSRRQVLRPKILNLNDVVSEVLGVFARVIGEDITLVDRLDEELGEIKADPSQLEQVVLNLVVNARDAMPDGGRLTIETANVDVSLAEADAQSMADGPYVRLAVVDTGHGMDSKVRANIFEPFFSTKGLGKGTGLGLSTVYGIVRQSQGQITVSSEIGEGTRFEIYLPRIEDEATPRSADEGAAEPVSGSEEILVVEDDDALRDLIIEALAMHGYGVLEADCGDRALAICEQHPRQLDLLISDVVMPDMRGPELVAELKGSRPELKVLYMSGYIDDVTVRHNVETAGIPFLEKPFTSGRLISKVREILDG